MAAPYASADDGWVAVERAGDCRVLAVSTDCVATAWDVAEPLNRIYAGSGGGPEAAIRGAVAAAGPYANDVQVRCTWWPREQPAPPSQLTSAVRSTPTRWSPVRSRDGPAAPG